MEKRFRVWTYKEGEPPLFHKGPMADIYCIEGHLIDELESGNSPFSVRHPDEALAFFLPVSILNIIVFVYRPYTNFFRSRLQNVVKDYIDTVSTKYPYWNRSSGADHFLVSCHDWAPDVSAAHPDLYKHFIRVLCNANSSEGFKPSEGCREASYNRSIFAFFAGGAHGYVRKQLFSFWKGKADEIQVHEYLPKPLNYAQLMHQSKFCLCPSGHEVASPRVVESIVFSKFSVHIPVAKIPQLKKILQGISEDEYTEMQKQVLQVQRHFSLNRPAKPYDILHMVMHSVWLRRLNRRLPPLHNA
ncbi:hypothetical protein Pint_12434 [Pistacia integerrima]|uniref:Uncharacterized protein n=1 Tax=Pistacia integerrima TaxID=434235 RepID=A0ACC0Y6C0_9ROSI|nr:hypothetical protein Pint_12434 [Pistacia integerrima]